MLREAYCPDAMKKLSVKWFKEGQENMKNDEKTGWPTNSVNNPTMTGKKVTNCNRKTEQRQRNCREVLD